MSDADAAASNAVEVPNPAEECCMLQCMMPSSFDTSHTPTRSMPTVGHLPPGTASGVGVACLTGRKACKSQPNQDTWSVFHTGNGNVAVYAVFDGHGTKGHVVSNLVKERFARRLLGDWRVACADQVAAALHDTFRVTQRSLEGMQSASLSGTTATVAVHDLSSGRLTVAHVGDSAAVLGSRTAGTECTGSLAWQAVRLTRDHAPELEDEADRIRRAGGRIKAQKGGCQRVYRGASDLPGINLSRTLGDAYGQKHCGISAVPEVATRCIALEDEVLLLCSDGIWSVLSPKEAVALVSGFDRTQATVAAERLAREARSRWLSAGGGGGVVDDITVILAYLQEDAADDRSRRPSAASTHLPHGSTAGSATPPGSSRSGSTASEGDVSAE